MLAIHILQPENNGARPSGAHNFVRRRRSSNNKQKTALVPPSSVFALFWVWHGRKLDGQVRSAMRKEQRSDDARPSFVCYFIILFSHYIGHDRKFDGQFHLATREQRRSSLQFSQFCWRLTLGPAEFSTASSV
jgi:hypothetical protein